jgi:hypothetical protein
VRKSPQESIALPSRDGSEGSRRDEAAEAAVGSEAPTLLASPESGLYHDHAVNCNIGIRTCNPADLCDTYL